MVRVGVIGLGKMGILHASILNRLPLVEVVGLMDVNSKQASFVRSLGLSAPFFTSARDLLHRVGPDAVFICVPPRFTLDAAEPCLNRGVAVFVEKPLADTLERARQLVEIGERNPKRPHAVGYVMGHLPTFRKARQLLRMGIIGHPVSLSASILVDAVFSPIRGWMGNRDLAGGGAVAQLGSHLLFLLYWLIGPVAEVEARMIHRYNYVEDEAQLTLLFASGCQGDVRIAWDSEGYPSHAVTLTVQGERGTITVSNRELFLDDSSGSQFWHAAHLAQPGTAFSLGGEGYAEEDQEFLSSLNGGPRPTVTLQAGLVVQEILDAIYRSAEEGRRIHIEDVKE